MKTGVSSFFHRTFESSGIRYVNSVALQTFQEVLRQRSLEGHFFFGPGMIELQAVGRGDRGRFSEETGDGSLSPLCPLFQRVFNNFFGYSCQST